MVVCAGSLSPRLRRELERLSREKLSIAEINRRLGARAAELRVHRLSYSRVRQLVHIERDRYREPSWGELLLDVDLRLRDPIVLLEKAAGTLPVREDEGLR
ncbi:MAG: hypothetical protein ACJ757_13235 [Gaiellaceae bacterium]